MGISEGINSKYGNNFFRKRFRTDFCFILPPLAEQRPQELLCQAIIPRAQ